jgi:hypothetical protein
VSKFAVRNATKFYAIILEMEQAADDSNTWLTARNAMITGPKKDSLSSRCFSAWNPRFSDSSIPKMVPSPYSFSFWPSGRPRNPNYLSEKADDLCDPING